MMMEAGLEEGAAVVEEERARTQIIMTIKVCKNLTKESDFR